MAPQPRSKTRPNGSDNASITQSTHALNYGEHPNVKSTECFSLGSRGSKFRVVFIRRSVQLRMYATMHSHGGTNTRGHYVDDAFSPECLTSVR